MSLRSRNKRPRKEIEVQKEKEKEEKEKVKKIKMKKRVGVKKKEKDHHLVRFLDIFKKLEITMPFGEALQQMSLYSKFLKDMLTRKYKYIH